jgi:hypothetical protein
MPPSDALPPSAPALVPLAGSLPRCGRLFCAHRADDTYARKRVVRRRRVTGSPRDRQWSKRGEGLPGAWAVLFLRALVAPPPDTLLSSPTSRRDRCGLQGIQPSRHPGRLEVAEPHTPWPARAHAYASPTPFLTPSHGWLPAQAGSPWAGRVLHPLDDRRSFMKVSSLHSPSTSIAWSHYTSYPLATGWSRDLS